MWFSTHLLKWYKANKRSLPWRKTKDPYHIWISEIVLQQTRVDQGLPYYERFIERFPNVHSLAQSDESEVLKAWQGLGYYSRARNLHHAAKTIVNDYNGVFPDTHDEIIKLKGIGSYTAAAISSICFKEAKPVVDGNVYRVLARFYGVEDSIDSTPGKKRFAALADKVMNKKDPGEYNQAIMEFGALYCKPSSPNCEECHLKAQCIAKKNNIVEFLPKKSRKVKQRDRYFNYIFIKGDRGSFYQKRLKKDIWQNMYEPLLIEAEKHLNKNEILKSESWKRVFGKEGSAHLVGSKSIEHKLTHQIIKAKFWETQVVSAAVARDSALQEFEHTQLKKIPIPRLIERYLERQK